MDSSILSSAAAAFGARPEDCSLLRGGNFSKVYSFPHQGKEYVLRLTPPNQDINEQSLRANLALMDYLAQGAVSVPAPLHSLRGELVETFPSDEGLYFASAFEKIEGILGEELPFSAWNAERFAILGRAVGRFHARARTYNPLHFAFDRPHWDQVGNCFHPTETLSDDVLRRRHAEALAGVQAFPRDPDAYGLIHTDLHGGNFMLDPRSGCITLIDFDDSAYGWYAMDIAMSLHDFCILTPETDKDAFAAGFLHAFLCGYLPENPLEPIWIERLPLFLKLLETGIFAQVEKFDVSQAPDSWVGRFMKGRRERIIQGLPVVEIDFAVIYRKALG
jgi:Ser/Thr protein kinase RdoA (MazF antagonist)